MDDKDDRIFESLLDLMNIEQRMLWYAGNRNRNDKYISNKAFCYLIYPRRAYDENKSTISRKRTNLVSNRYFNEFNYCQGCGREFKSLPETCPNCQFQILDIDLELEVANNEGNGKNPHSGVRPSPRAIKEMDKFYLSARDTLKEYKRNRNAGIKYRILKHIIGIQKYNGKIKNQEERPDLILTCVDGISKELNVIKKLWPKMLDNLDITFWEEYNRARKQNSETFNGEMNRNILKEIEKLRLYVEGFTK